MNNQLFFRRTDMRTKMRIKVGLLLLLMNTFVVMNSFTQVIPLVYDVENTGVDCTQPPLPDLGSLPKIVPLNDPFEWADGSGRSTDFKDWEHRRNEIAAEIEHYEIGTKPPRPDTISASWNKGDSTLTVNITRNGNMMTLTARIVLPDTGSGPFPAIIGVAFGASNLPGSKIATVAFQHNQVSTYGQAPSTSDPYYKLYPELLGHSGQYSAWAWGVSRIIDGLELTQDSLPIDLHRLGVAGCSYAGKLALFAGAFDERIALTISQESGGGGATAWRVSETLQGVETLGATDHKWFRPEMFQFAGSNVSYLPEDHHELMAMVAPRALYATANPSYTWLANPSCYVASRACQKVYDTLGISDRFGFSVVGDHGHCAMPNSQLPEVGAFIDKFLMGDTTANTSNIATNPYPFIDYNAWTSWWGTGNPVFPERDANGAETVELEPECAVVGSDWIIKKGDGSSVGYVYESGVDSINSAPTDSAGIVYIPFTLQSDSLFYVFERSACSNDNNDSYWFKMDDGNFIKRDGLNNAGTWAWDTLGSYHLTAGNHTLAIAFCEDGAWLDKICISSYAYFPIGMGDTAVNVCEPEVTVIKPPQSGINLVESTEGFALGQNYPNPAYGNTVIPFIIPRDTYVSLKIYSVLGNEIEELAGKEYSAGKHTVDLNTRNLSKGIYFYTLKTDKFSATRRMIIQSE